MSEKLSKDQVKKIAQLANLVLTEQEIEVFTKQLSEVIDYNVAQLAKVNTEKTEPLLNVSGLTNSFRDDETDPGLTNKEVLKNTQNSYNGFVKVKAILEQENDN